LANQIWTRREFYMGLAICARRLWLLSYAEHSPSRVKLNNAGMSFPLGSRDPSILSSSKNSCTKPSTALTESALRFTITRQPIPKSRRPRYPRKSRCRRVFQQLGDQSNGVGWRTKTEDFGERVRFNLGEFVFHVLSFASASRVCNCVFAGHNCLADSRSGSSS
jgi:hypothetical protein